MKPLPELSEELCRVRQQRLREALVAMDVARAVVVASENVQWLTGFRPHPLMRAVVELSVEGGCLLIAPGAEPEFHAADCVRTFEAQWLCTLRQDQFEAALECLPKSSVPTAVEYSCAGTKLVTACEGKHVDVDPVLWTLRRKKEADEVRMIQHAIACTDAMYLKAREILQPGISELDMFRQLQNAAVAAAGEPLTALGNDYQSNSPGGPPRDRQAQSGELMILDLGPAYRGYHADNCRTFAVDRNPTEEQLRAREVILPVFDLVRSYVRPGASCRELFVQANAILDEYAPKACFHHLGHGIGLYPHEAPHLNPNWDDRFAEGDVFAVEPGIYADHLRAGIRIEENFLVTVDGVQQLTSTPTEL